MTKRFLALAALALLLAAPAHAENPKGGFGFRTATTPFFNLPIVSPFFEFDAVPSLGIRHWLSPNVGVDLGVGYNNLKFEPGPTTYTGFTFDLGVPLSVKAVNDKVNLIFRPGFQWGSIEDESGTPTLKWTGMAISGELEVEWMVIDNLSISASQGLSYNTISDDGSPSTEITSFRTTGSNFMNLGFHVYLW